MFDGRRSGFQQAGAAISDRPHFAEPFLGPAHTALSCKLLAQGDRDGTSHCVAGQAREHRRQADRSRSS